MRHIQNTLAGLILTAARTIFKCFKYGYMQTKTQNFCNKVRKCFTSFIV